MKLWTTAATLAVGFMVSGCSGTFSHLLENMHKTIPAPTSAMPEPVKGNHARARYCLDRAKEDAVRADVDTVFDVLMVTAGGVATGAGTTFGALSAAMEDSEDDDSSAKQNWAVAGATLVASGAAILLLRTALNLSDSARAKRTAAANRVGAVGRIMNSATTDDASKAFDVCIAEDINVATAQPGGQM